MSTPHNLRRTLCLTGVAALAAAGSAQAAVGDYLVADPEADGGSGAIIEVDRNTGTRSWVSANSVSPGPAFVDPWNLDNEPGGSAYLEGGDGEPSTGDADALLVADPGASGGSGAIFRVDEATGERTILSDNADAGPPLSSPYDVVVAPDGAIYIVDAGIPGVLEVDPQTGNRTNVSSNGSPAGAVNFQFPIALGVDAAGSIIVVEFDGAGSAGDVIRVNPATGARAIVSDAATGAGTNFTDPGGIAHDAEGIYVTDSGSNAGQGSVFDVNAANGDRTIVSENGSPVDLPQFENPADLEVDGYGQIVMTDATTMGGAAVNGGGGVIRVDPATGNRVRVSRNADPAGVPEFYYPWGILIDPLDFVAVLNPGVLFPRGGGGIPVAFSLSQPARVEFKVQRKSANGSYGTARKFSRRAAKGTTRGMRIPGKPLKPGEYRATLQATGRGRVQSQRVSVEFKIRR